MDETDSSALKMEDRDDGRFGAGLNLVRTEYELLRLMRQRMQHFGFSHFMIARLPSGGEQRFSELLAISNWSADLVRQYTLSGSYAGSGLVSSLSRSRLPVFADASLFSVPGMPEGVLPAFATIGFDRTFAVMMHTTQGEAYAVTLSGSRSEPQGTERAEIYFALLHLFDGLEQTFERDGAMRDTLSAREIECLRWAAAGKSSDEIAIILGISTYTVSSYFKTATRKLDAVNRMQAIARAIRLKLV